MVSGGHDRGAPAVSPGDVIAGKYRVERVLASGGMGVVLTAWHEALRQRVAIKLLLPSLVTNPEALRRFQREARAAAQLRSHHAIRVYDVDTLDDGSPYMVMEHLEGEALDQMLSRVGALRVVDAVDFTCQALSAIAEAHAAGIVHRDLKPGNVFVHHLPDGRRVVKVLDFGISKLTEGSELGAAGSGHDITSSQSLLGTPAYMAPEQMVSSRDVDGRGDLWSIGAILYELLTGRMLFEAETAGAVFAKIIHMPIPPLRSLRPEVPKELEEVVFRCLERDPRHRVSTAVELMEALFPFASEAIGSLRVDSLRRTIAAPAGAAAPRAPATDLTFGQSTRARGSRLPVVIPSVIAISLAAVLGWQFLASSPPDAGPRAPAPASAPEAVLDEADETDGAPGEEDADEEPEAEAAPQPMTSASASASATASVAPPAPPPPRWRGLGLDDRR